MTVHIVIFMIFFSPQILFCLWEALRLINSWQQFKKKYASSGCDLKS